MALGVLRDLVKHTFHRDFDPPAKIALGVARVHDYPGYVIWPRAGVAAGGVGAEARIAPGIQARERNRVGAAASGAVDALAIRSRGAVHLGIHQSGEIARMEQVANLFPGPVKPDEAERSAARVRMDPIRKDALIGSSELPRPGQHATAIDPYRKAESVAIFERQSFGRELGVAVE